MTNGALLETWLVCNGVPWDKQCELPFEVKQTLLMLHRAKVIGWQADLNRDYRLRKEIREMTRFIYAIMPFKGKNAPTIDRAYPPMGSIEDEYPIHAKLKIVSNKL